MRRLQEEICQTYLSNDGTAGIFLTTYGETSRVSPFCHRRSRSIQRCQGQNGRRRSRRQTTWEKVGASDTLRNGRLRPFGNDRLDIDSMDTVSFLLAIERFLAV
jgi:hypothetical protein